MNERAQMSAVFQNEISNFVPSESLVSSFNPPGSNVRVAQPSSAWILALQDRFDELTSLPRGWDGYAGLPVSFNCAQFAANLIERLCVAGVPAPQLVPGADGTLQIEWHLNQFDIEIDVLAPYNVVATRLDHVSGQEEDLELEADFTELSEWIVELGQDRALQHQVGG